MTPSAFETTNNQVDQNHNNGFAAVLSPDGSSLLYSTFIHGSKGAPPAGVALKPGCSGNCWMHIVGSSATTNQSTSGPIIDFPVTTTGFQKFNRDSFGNTGAYVTVIDPSINGAGGLIYSSFFSGAGKNLPNAGDGATGVTVAANGLAYVTGYTFSAGTGTGFTTTSTAYQLDNKRTQTTRVMPSS